MAALEGLLEGILGRKREVELQNIRASELAANREASIYQALLGSDNPEIVNMAVAGMLESAQPRKRKGGMAGWVGETEASPTFQRLQTFLQTPQQVPVTEQRETLPARFGVAGMAAPSVQPTLTQPPAGAPAAQAPTSPVSPTAPPPTPMQYTTEPPQPYTIQTGIQAKLPSVFLSPEQRIIQNAREKGLATEATQVAEFRGDYNAVRQTGGTHEQAMAFAMQRRGTTAANLPRYGGIVAGSSLPLGSKDSFGRPVSPSAFYRRETVNGMEQFIPTIAPSSAVGTLRVLAAPNGRPAVYRIFPDNTTEFVQEVPAGVEQIPVQNPDGSMEIVPIPRQFQAPSGGGATSTPPPAPTASATPVPAPAAAAPTQAPPAPAAAGPTRTASGGIQTRPSTAEQEATKRQATRLTAAENAQFGTPAGTTWGEVDRQGLVPLVPDVRRAVDQIDVALTQMDRMEALVKKVYGGTYPAIARIAGPAMERLAQEGSLTWAMNSDDYRDLLAAKNLAIPGVARRTGEVGNLTQTEQDRASEALPNLGEGLLNTPDTLSAALGKIANLKEQLKSQRDIFTRGAGARANAGANEVPAELQAAPPGSVWEDEQGVPRLKKLLDGSIVPY